MIRKLALVVLLSTLSTYAFAGFGIWQVAGPGASQSGWNSLTLGPGGQVTSVDIQCVSGWKQCNASGSTTKIARTDTYNLWYFSNAVAYCGNSYAGQPSTGCWEPLFTPSRMPNGAALGNGTPQGAYEAVTAAGNSNHAYAIWAGDGCLYTTTNLSGVAAATAQWTKPTQPSGACLPGGDGGNTYDSNPGAAGSKFFRHFIAVSPAAENVALVSTPNAGSYYTQNGGTNWTILSALGDGTITSDGTHASYGGTIFAFDPSDATGNTVYACTYGTGVFKITSMRSTPSVSELNTTGMPTACRDIEVDPVGDVWVADDTNTSFQSGTGQNVHLYNGSSWSLLSPTTTQVGWFYVTIDYNNCASAGACHVTLTDQGGGVVVTSTGSAGFGTRSPGNSDNVVYTANDVPWISVNGNNLSPGGDVYDMAQSNVVDMPMGVGYLEFTPPASASNLNVTSLSAGIAQFPGIWSISAPVSSSQPIFSVYDRNAITMGGNYSTYPSTVSRCNSGFDPGYDINYVASTPADIVCLADQASWGSGISTNNGSSFTLFSGIPNEIQPISSCCVAEGGGIAFSTPLIGVIYAANNGDIFYTTDGGNTWPQSIISTIPTGGIFTASSGTSSGGTTLHLTVPSYLQTGINSDSWSMQVLDLTNNMSAVTVSAATSSTLTVSAVGSNVSTNDVLWVRPNPGDGSLSNASFNLSHRVCADAAGNGTFYLYTDQPTTGTASTGIYVTTSVSSGWALGWSGSFQFSNSGTSARLQCVPGVNNEMYGTGNGGNGAFYDCLDNGTHTTGSITCTAVTTANGFGANVTGVTAVCFGKAHSGQSYPTMYIVGTVGGTTSVWRSIDHLATSGGFTDLNARVTSIGGTPIDTFDGYQACTGDMNDSTFIALLMANSDGYWGRFN